MVKFVVNEGLEHRCSPVTWDDVGWWTLNLLITGQEVQRAERPAMPSGQAGRQRSTGSSLTKGAWSTVRLSARDPAGNARPPFVLVKEGSGNAGYAARRWVIHLLDWTWDKAPSPRREEIIGPLLGYSPEEVWCYSELRSTLEASR